MVLDDGVAVPILVVEGIAADGLLERGGHLEGLYQQRIVRDRGIF